MKWFFMFAIAWGGLGIHNAFAGRPYMNLSCTEIPSNATDVTVKGKIYSDLEGLDIVITQGKNSNRLKQDTYIFMINDLKNGVFSLITAPSKGINYYTLSIYAIPKSVKVASPIAHASEHFIFEAILENTRRPGTSSDAFGEKAFLRNVRMQCDYSL